MTTTPTRRMPLTPTGRPSRRHRRVRPARGRRRSDDHALGAVDAARSAPSGPRPSACACPVTRSTGSSAGPPITAGPAAALPPSPSNVSSRPTRRERGSGPRPRDLQLGGARDGAALVDEDTVHVGQPALRRAPLHGCSPLVGRPFPAVLPRRPRPTDVPAAGAGGLEAGVADDTPRCVGGGV